MLRIIFTICIALTICIPIWSANAATSIPFTISTSETVNVTGTPRIAVDVGGVTRYATYTSGTGTSSLTFTYTMVAGDVDLDGVTLTSPMQLNGGTIKDLNGNDATLTFTVPNTSNVKVNYPSLGMDFVADADGRYTLNGTVYNDLTSFLSAAGGTFTRASIGTYYDASGTLQTAASGTPRFDYDPVTHAAKGILIEESRTNLLQSSEEIINPSWNTALCTISLNSQTAPDGSITADEITASSSVFPIQGYAWVSGLTYTYSIYAKAISDNTFGMRMSSMRTGPAQDQLIIVDLLAGTAAYFPGHQAVGATVMISLVGSGYYRIAMTAPANNSAVGYVSIEGATGIAFWGAQLEAGSFATSYIPTAATTVTRQADILTMPTAPWLNNTEGTFFSETNTVSSQNAAVFGAGTTTSDILRVFRQSDSQPVSQVVVAGVHQATIGMGAINWPQTSTPKIGMAYKQNDFSSTVNGNAATTDTSGNLPTVSSMTLGTSPGLPALDGSVKKLKYYPVRISDPQLQMMTQ